MIFSAPTSAGKSLVADLLTLRPLLLAQEKKKHGVDTTEEMDVQVEQELPDIALMVMPFLSLIMEKEAKVGPLLETLSIGF